MSCITLSKPPTNEPMDEVVSGILDRAIKVLDSSLEVKTKVRDKARKVGVIADTAKNSEKR